MGFEQIGKYRILHLLGQGAMGEVYKAHDPTLNRHVAIKIITPGLVLDEQFKLRFQREAQSEALLSHRNIVTVYELGEEGGIVYLVMEFLGGRDLREIIDRGRRLLSLSGKLRVVEQICEGLAFAHERGIVHRDLKPANVHVLPSGTVKILDFGLARLSTSDLTRSGSILGTPNYMSPEQVRGERVDARSDVFAVGAVLYELLSGYKAFRSESPHSTLYDVLERDPTPLRTLLPRIPPAIAALSERALQKDPGRRFPTASAMKEAVEAARIATDTAGIDLEETLVGTEVRTGGYGAEVVSTALVDGAAALDLAGRRRESPATAHPDAPTVASASPPTLPGTFAPPRRRRLAVLAAAAVVVAVAVVYWPRPGPAPRGAEPSEAALADLEREWIAGHAAMARMSLETRDYTQAVEEAELVLSRDPAQPEAREIREEGRRLLSELQMVAADTRAAFASGDQVRAAEALQQVLAIDSHHPVVAEVGPALDRYFRPRAENARRVAARARSVAQGAGASTSPPFGGAMTLLAEAEAHFERARFAQATQKFLDAGDGFVRARLQREAATVAALPAAGSRAVAAPEPLPMPERAPPMAAPPFAPATLPPRAAVASAPVPPPALASSNLPDPEHAVREVVADYGRALESRDLGLFKSVMPGLTREQERRVRASFRDMGRLRVSLDVQAIEITGARATAHVSRRDTLDGKARPPILATFTLAQKDGVWAIESIGQ